MSIHSCPILSNERCASDVYRLKFLSEPIARNAQPGQFVHIRTSVQTDPLLPRPFSIHDVDVASEGVEVLFKRVGDGTRILSSKRVGEAVDVLGPLGHGFRTGEGRGGAVLVAGGMGIAPFPFLVRRLVESGHSVLVVAGWRTAEEIVGIDSIESLGASVDVATEDGNRGFSGTVTELLEARLQAGDFGAVSDIGLYACGPKAMFPEVARLARLHRIPCQVSLEERMACGVGVCSGCAVSVGTLTGTDPEYKLVCRDGPVFDMKEVCPG